MFRDFKRDLAPGIRVTNGAPAYLDRVTFRNLEVLRKTRGDIVEASAIAAYPGATLSLVVRPHHPRPACRSTTFNVVATTVIVTHVHDL